MFKRVIALSTAAILLLSPMSASAVTWKEVVDGLKTSNSYTKDGLTATKDGDKYTFEGGELEDDVNFDFDEGGTFYFNGVKIENMYVITDENSYYVILDENTKVGDVYAFAKGDSQIKLVNEGIIGKKDGEVHLIVRGNSHFTNKGTLETGVGRYAPELDNQRDTEDVSASGYADGIVENGTQEEAEKLVDRMFTFDADGTYTIVVTLEWGEGRNSHVQDFLVTRTIGDPTPAPTTKPTDTPSTEPTTKPTDKPTTEPTTKPTDTPTTEPTTKPTDKPTTEPTTKPTDKPTTEPTTKPTEAPTSEPTTKPTEAPTNEPTPTPTPAPTPDANEDAEEEVDYYREMMEEKRRAEAVGGVTGSPYWVKQMYLGHNSYNLRLYIDGEPVLMRERLSWNGYQSKGITLRVNTVAPEKLTMRLDEKALEIFERTNITTVTLVDKENTPVMQYNVSDLRGAYDQYGLDGEDLLVVGGMNDDVMKIGADGQLVPVE